MEVGKFTINFYLNSYPPTAEIVYHYNPSVSEKIKVDENSIHHLEFIVQEIKRKFEGRT